MFEFLEILTTNPLVKWTVVCILVLYAIYRYYASKPNHWESQGVRTASVSFYTRLTAQWHEWERQLVCKNGKVFGIYEMSKPVLFLSDVELIRDVLVKDFHIFNNRRDFRTGGDPLVDNMLSAVTDDQWKRIRSIMSPTFTTGKLKKMLPLIDECLKNLIKNLDKLSKSKEESDLKQVFGAYAMEVVIQVAFGTKVDALFDDNNPIIVNARKMFQKNISPKIFLVFLMPKLAKFLKITVFDSSVTKFFSDFTLNIIAERKLKKDKIQRIDFLQLMLDSMQNNGVIDEEESEEQNEIKDKYSEINGKEHINKTLTNDEFVAQCVLFFLAGYETTSTTISLTLYNIAKHPEVQQKLYSEAKEFFNQSKDVNYDQLLSLKYLNAVINETQRLFPAAIFLERVANQDYILGQTGINIRKGDIVHIPTYAIQRDPDYFADPEEFKPERFLSENIAHHPYAYLPFGAGPRNCIGMRLAQMEVKIAVINAVYKYKFNAPSKPLQYYQSGGLIVPKEVSVRIEKR